MRRLLNIPNTLTLSRILLTPLFIGLFFTEGWYWQYLALLVFGIASLTDKYDGHFARRDRTATAFGRFLDPLADKILALSAFISFVMKGLVEAWLVWIILSREVIITSIRMYATCNGRQMTTSRLAKWKTTVQLSAILFSLIFINLKATFSGLRFHPSFFDNGWSYYLLNGSTAAAMLLTVISGVYYLLGGAYHHRAKTFN
ncbi:MAG TPA: CDP-diacylglycerol--glycerol-3-phosphate 3-phosphatidyltransferase [Candidatus Latescibacteria bacterium]|nr:CDP-diacylglycerol--glycerol-3-phosphate 3-phosphatidyltransferase [Candidatus Latescibacterota bacterium]